MIADGTIRSQSSFITNISAEAEFKSIDKYAILFIGKLASVPGKIPRDLPLRISTRNDQAAEFPQLHDEVSESHAAMAINLALWASSSL